MYLTINVFKLAPVIPYIFDYPTMYVCFLFSVFLDNSNIEAVGLYVLIGPSLANLSLLRFLLLINIASASKLSSYFGSPWSLIQLWSSSITKLCDVTSLKKILSEMGLYRKWSYYLYLT